MGKVPNLLSLTRLFFAPFVPLLAFVFGPLHSGTLFFALALSDALDGFLARLLRAETFLGRLLDPIADKVLMFSGLLSVTYIEPVLEPSLLYLLLARDVALLLGSSLLIRRGFVPAPSLLGKATTLFVSLTVALAYLKAVFALPFGESLLRLLYLTSLLLVLSSWFDYYLKGAGKLIMER